MHRKITEAGEQYVVIGHVLASDVTLGYGSLCNTAVLAVNGTRAGEVSD